MKRTLSIAAAAAALLVVACEAKAGGKTDHLFTVEARSPGKVGAGESVRFCDTRLEGDPQRTACDYLATGKSPATGRWGPTWYWNGKPCDGENFTSCANHQDNQFMAIAKTSGLYEACAGPGVPIHPDGQACGGKTIK